MQFLKDVLPLEAIELSHFLASVAGALLLLLARSLQRRINAAYHLTIILLFAGIVFSLLKGFDYEEAIILSIILLAFLPCRVEFYRKAAIFARRFDTLWFILIFIVIACSFWIGFFSYRHIEYSNELWWKFAFHSDAPRFLRASSGVVIVVLLFAVMQLLLPSKPKTSTPTDDVLETVRQIVNASDITEGNIALLGDKEFLFNDKKNAFLMYGVEGKSWITLGGPIGPESEWSELIWKFRELCDYYDGWPVFYQIENKHLDYYVDIGLSFLKLGEEAIVDLKKFTLEGGENKNLRNAQVGLHIRNCASAEYGQDH
jgi:phosphatidylglycerol lysyltransferase